MECSLKVVFDNQIRKKEKEIAKKGFTQTGLAFITTTDISFYYYGYFLTVNFMKFVPN